MLNQNVLDKLRGVTINLKKKDEIEITFQHFFGTKMGKNENYRVLLMFNYLKLTKLFPTKA